jgi:hypothetical protein
MRHLRELEQLPKLRDRNRELRARVKHLTSAQRGSGQAAARLTTEVGRLETRVRQLVAAHETTEKEAGEVARITVFSDPVLPEDAYDALVRAVPPPAFLEHLPANRQQLSVPIELAPQRSRRLWGFFASRLETEALVPAVTTKFHSVLDDYVRGQWPLAASRGIADVPMQPTMSRILLRRPGYEIKPHRDPRWSFLTCLLYLPRRDESRLFGAQLGYLRQEREADSQSPLYVEPEECDFVKEVPGRPNTALIFLNSQGVHSASIPADGPEDTCRHLYQLQLGPDLASKKRLLKSMPSDSARRWKRDGRAAAY